MGGVKKSSLVRPVAADPRKGSNSCIGGAGGQRVGRSQVYVMYRSVAGPAGVSGAVVMRGAVSMPLYARAGRGVGAGSRYRNAASGLGDVNHSAPTLWSRV